MARSPGGHRQKPLRVQDPLSPSFSHSTEIVPVTMTYKRGTAKAFVPARKHPKE